MLSELKSYIQFLIKDNLVQLYKIDFLDSMESQSSSTNYFFYREKYSKFQTTDLKTNFQNTICSQVGDTSIYIYIYSASQYNTCFHITVSNTLHGKKRALNKCKKKHEFRITAYYKFIGL